MPLDRAKINVANVVPVLGDNPVVLGAMDASNEQFFKGEVDFLEGIHRRFELWLPPADSELTTREQTKPTCRLEGDL